MVPWKLLLQISSLCHTDWFGINYLTGHIGKATMTMVRSEHYPVATITGLQEGWSRVEN